jgi:PAS domain S-box-containing protein
MVNGADVFLEDLPFAMAIVSHRLRFQFVNRTLAEWYGRPPQQIVGRYLKEILTPDSYERLEKYARRALNGERVSYEEISVSYPDGRRRSILTDLVPRFGRHGRVLGYLCAIRDISKRIELESALHKSEELYRQAEAIARLGHWSWTAAPQDGPLGGRLWYSDAAAAIYGGNPNAESLSIEGSIGRHVHPEDRARLRRLYLEEAKKRLPEHLAEYRMLRPDGSVTTIREVARNQYDADGRLISAFGTIQDITDLRRVEKSSRQADMHLRQAAHIAKIGYWRMTPGLSGLWHDAVVHFSEPFLASDTGEADEISMTLGASISRFIHPEDRRAYISATDKMFDTCQRESYLEYRILRGDGTPAYMAEFGQNTFDADGRFLYAFGVTQDISELRRVESELSERESLYRQAARLAKLGHWRMTPSPSGRWQDAMIEICQLTAGLFGATPPKKMPFMESVERVLHPDDRQAYLDQMAHIYENGVRDYTLQYRVQRDDGAVVYFAETGENVFDARGRLRYAFGTTQDITDLKCAELELSQSEAHFRQAERIAKIGHWRIIAAPSGRWRDARLSPVDTVAANLTRVPTGPSVTLEEAIQRIVHPEDRDAYIAASEHIYGTRQPDYSLEYRMIREDGSVMHVLEVGENTFDADGRLVSTVGTTQDITDRKRIEIALHQSETRYRRAEQIAGLCHWHWQAKLTDDWDAGLIDHSPMVEKILGLAADQLRLSAREFIERFVHPADRAMVADSLASIHRGAERYEIDYRIQRSDGELRLIHEIGERGPNLGNGLISIMGTMQDVTEMRRARASAPQAQRTAPEATIVTDSRGVIRIFSSSAEKIFGHSAEEILGQPVEILIPMHLRSRHPDHVEDFYRSPERELGGAERREVLGLRKSGETFAAEINISKAEFQGRTVFTAIVRDLGTRADLKMRLGTLAAQQPGATDTQPLTGQISSGAADSSEWRAENRSSAGRANRRPKNSTR